MKNVAVNSGSPKGYTVNDFLNNVPIGRTSLYRLIREGNLKSVKICGRRIIPATEADRLLEQGGVSTSYQSLEPKLT